MACFDLYAYLPTFTYEKRFPGWITDTMGSKHIELNSLFSAQNDILL